MRRPKKYEASPDVPDRETVNRYSTPPAARKNRAADVSFSRGACPGGAAMV